MQIKLIWLVNRPYKRDLSLIPSIPWLRQHRSVSPICKDELLGSARSAFRMSYLHFAILFPTALPWSSTLPLSGPRESTLLYRLVTSLAVNISATVTREYLFVINPSMLCFKRPQWIHCSQYCSHCYSILDDYSKLSILWFRKAMGCTTSDPSRSIVLQHSHGSLEASLSLFIMYLGFLNPGLICSSGSPPFSIYRTSLSSNWSNNMVLKFF